MPRPCQALQRRLWDITEESPKRVGLSMLMAVLRLLQRAAAIRCEACFTINIDRPTEPQNITLKEYLVLKSSMIWSGAI